MKSVDHATKKCNACGQTCSEDYINVMRHDDVANAIKASNVQIAKYQSKEICQMTWGYGGCSSLESSDRDNLIELLPVLERYQRSINKGQTPCLCPEQIQKVVEQVKKYADFTVCSSKTYDNHSIDVSNLDDYINMNIGPVAYMPWERALRLKMPSFDITVDLKKCMRFVYDIKVEMGEKFKPGYVYELEVAREKVCNIQLKTEVEYEKCQIEYKTVVEKVPSCSINFDTYVEMRRCGIQTDTIIQLQKCDIDVSYDVEAQDFVIEPQQGQQYRLSELKDIDKVIKNL